MNRQVDLLIVMPWLLFAFHQQEAELSAVGAELQIVVGRRMGVIPPGSRGLRSERIPVRAPGGNHWRALFHRAVVQRVDRQTMPVDDVRIVARIGHVNRHRHTLAQPKQRPRNLPVIPDRLHSHALTNLQRAGIDAEGVIGLSRRRNRKRTSLFCLKRQRGME